MIKNKTINVIVYIICGLLGGFLLIIFSELIKFSHFNLLPLGGESWAIWLHAFAFGISFGVLSKLFKIHKAVYISLSITIFCIILLEIFYNGLLFINPIPFGIGLN